MAKHNILYSVVQRVTDLNRNQIIVKEDQLTHKRLKIALKLHGSFRERSIASVDLERKCMYMKREHAKHYHFLSKSYGFNWTLVNDSAGWDTLLLSVQLPDGNMELYKIPRTVLLQKGRAYQFAGKGFELQRFVPVDELKPYRVKDFLAE